ncbi:MAG TPA: Spy/CpxP family protein refolding chaperone [Rhodanobacteraceae bacterium]|nr:Spy/CpxP family protein refolding chaperone [Rhodanobacteraceae bacterium]
MRNPMIRSTLLAAMLACSSLAFAAAPQQAAAPATTPRTHQQGQPNLFDELGLTDAQRSSVRQLMQQNFQQARPEMQALREKRVAFDKATPGTSQFQGAANDLAAAESGAAHDQVLRQADLRTKVYNLLTAEQRTRLASLVKQRQQEMQQRAAAPAASQ